MRATPQEYQRQAVQALTNALATYKEKETCPITLDNIADIPVEQRMQHVACGAVFEKNNIQMWLAQGEGCECPKCKVGGELGLRAQNALLNNPNMATDNDVAHVFRLFSHALRHDYTLAAHQLSAHPAIRAAMNQYRPGASLWLHQAAYFASPATMLVLIAAGANVNLLTNTADTALWIALSKGNTETALLLLKFGAVDRPDYWRRMRAQDQADALQGNAYPLAFRLGRKKERYQAKKRKYTEYVADPKAWHEKNQDAPIPYDPINELRHQHKILAPDQTPLCPSQIIHKFGTMTKKLKTMRFFPPSPEVEANLQHGTSRELLLHLACHAANVEQVQSELDRGANVAARNYRNETPLMYAVRSEFFALSFANSDSDKLRLQQLLDVLLDCGGQDLLQHRDEYGRDAVDHCLQHSCFTAFLHLLRRGADPFAQGNFKRLSKPSPIDFIPALQAYIQYKKTVVPAYAETVLHLAVRLLEDETTIIAMILKDRSLLHRLNQDGDTAYGLAVNLNKQKIVDYFDLMRALEKGDIEACRQMTLLSRGVNTLVVNSDFQYPLEFIRAKIASTEDPIFKNQKINDAFITLFTDLAKSQLNQQCDSFEHYVRHCVIVSENPYSGYPDYAQRNLARQHIQLFTRLSLLDGKNQRYIDEALHFGRDPMAFDRQLQQQLGVEVYPEMSNEEFQQAIATFPEDYSEMLWGGCHYQEIVKRLSEKLYEKSQDDTQPVSLEAEDEGAILQWAVENCPEDYDYAEETYGEDEEGMINYLESRYPSWRLGL